MPTDAISPLSYLEHTLNKFEAEINKSLKPLLEKGEFECLVPYPEGMTDKFFFLLVERYKSVGWGEVYRHHEGFGLPVKIKFNLWH